MAIRTHVVALRDVAVADAKALLIGVGIDAFQLEGGWIWTRCGAQDVDINSLDAALDGAGGTALRTTTVDGALWQLRLSGGSDDPFVAEHHFCLLDPARLRAAKKEFSELVEFTEGFRLPSSLVDDVGSSKLTLASMKALLGLHADLIAEHLEAADIPFDTRALKATLVGKRTTPTEVGWDVGNLPRFLSCLGLEEPFPEWRLWIEEEEAAGASQNARLAAIRLRPLDEVYEALAPHQAVELRGDPVELPLEHLTSLWYIGKHYASGFPMGFSVDAEGNTDVLDTLSQVELTSTAVVGDRIDVSIDDWTSAGDTIRSLSAALVGVADGSRFAFVTTRNTRYETRADQRFEGSFSGDTLLIDSTYPPMSSDDLVSVLDLMDQYREAKEVRVASEEERDAVLSEVADAIWFFDGAPTITADGLKLKVEPESEVDGVIEFLFLRRYGHVWDVAPRTAWHRENSKSAAAAVVRTDDLEPGEPFRIEAMDAPSHLPADFEERVAQAEAAGLESLGWIRAVMNSVTVFMATFVNESRDVVVSINGIEKGGELEVANLDAFSRLTGGPSLTTTTAVLATSQVDRGIFKFAAPGADIAGLLKWHAAHTRNRRAEAESLFTDRGRVIETIQAFLEYEGLAGIGA